MKIIKSPTAARIMFTNLSGYRADANFTVELTRVNFAGETAFAVDINGEISYCRSLADALNRVCSAIRTKDEQQQLLRALI